MKRHLPSHTPFLHHPFSPRDLSYLVKQIPIYTLPRIRLTGELAIVRLDPPVNCYRVHLGLGQNPHPSLRIKIPNHILDPTSKSGPHPYITLTGELALVRLELPLNCDRGRFAFGLTEILCRAAEVLSDV